jgi:hypothetical protein
MIVVSNDLIFGIWVLGLSVALPHRILPSPDVKKVGYHSALWSRDFQMSRGESHQDASVKEPV